MASRPPDQATDLPRLRVLGSRDKDRLHQAALTILARTGMEVHLAPARALLQEAGCRIRDDLLVTVPPGLVEKALASAPSSFTVFDRHGREAMEVGGRRSYFGTGSDLMYHHDPVTGRRREAVLEDVARAARLCQALEHIDFLMSYAFPSDLPPRRAWLKSLEAMVLNSTKPVVTVSDSVEDLARMWRIAAILRGGEDRAGSKPFLIHYTEPVSPLKHPGPSLAKLLYCAENRIPVTYSPAPIAGSTAPITPAGHLALGLAETLFGLVLHQLRAPGAPFILGMGPAVMDMSTSQCSYNAPEYYLAYVGFIEMSHYYDLPSWGYAGTSDSQLPDAQSAFEAGVLTYLAALCGANLCHDVGYLDFGRAGALEAIVLGEEYISQTRRFMEGLPVNEETLALEVIDQVGSRGHYLTQPHTLRHLRQVQWRPSLLNRQSFSQWRAKGAKPLEEVAREKRDALLAGAAPEPLNPALVERIRKVVENYK